MFKFILLKISPPIIVCLLIIIRQIFKYILNIRYFYKNKSGNNSKIKSNAVYIIGNGPSLNNFNLSNIYNSDVITMNYFYVHPEVNKLNIVAHCIGEPYESSAWVDPTSMVKNTPAKTFWFNFSAAKFCKKQFPENNILYYPPAFSADCSWLVGTSLEYPSIEYQSTSQMAIMVAIHMGYKKIFLLGLDHDWLTTKNGYSPHFYNEESDDGEIKRADFSCFSYLDMINISKNLFEIYKKIQKIASENKIKIVNLSNPTYLDIFPYSDN